MNKKVLISVILVVAVLGVAGFLFLSDNKGISPVTLSPTPEMSSSPTPAPTTVVSPTVSPTVPVSPSPSVTSTPTKTSTPPPPLPPPPPPSSPSPTPIITTHTVTYTDTGYSPGTTTVKVGDTVIFKNNSSGDMWPASNPHPAHTGYSGFDSVSQISPGGQWSFKFTVAGTWGYHDHLRPNKIGTIVVQ